MSQESLPTSDDGRLNRHIPCWKCGHDLFSSDSESNCPECGECIRAAFERWKDCRSVRSDLLYVIWPLFLGIGLLANFIAGDLSSYERTGPDPELLFLVWAAAFVVCTAGAMCAILVVRDNWKIRWIPILYPIACCCGMAFNAIVIVIDFYGFISM